jgi:hypothetical protein
VGSAVQSSARLAERWILGLRRISLRNDPKRGHDMRRVMVRYKVKPDQVQANERLVRAVYEELGRAAPAGLRYATFKLEDGVTFVHVASVDTADGQNPLGGVEAFARFQEGVAARCDEPPVATEMREVGSYRFFGDE